ncbi:phosphomannomutase [Leucobacter exalbidus]|uniref:Phosphomannomutase n=1 Tax=Leucobacter exalbidus TaxID=662960 RepID=A0A940PVZ8_9MICO|nr:phospho-sugar mutase [Leucobacter exalbidus]MBP1326196.1 phosphomannomutase [Leucobacter exalbidus]
MTSAELDQRIAAAEAWAVADIDPASRHATRSLIARAREGQHSAITEIIDAFSGRLTFGTAGLRGKVGPGPRRMNRVVISQTSAGFAQFLIEREQRSGSLQLDPPSVVIGYDGRTGSAVFARDAAEVMAGAGVRVFLLPEAGPTPLTAFAVRHLQVSAGVMITASHNPPADNGYKVFLGGPDEGAQIIPPTDDAIAQHIDRASQVAPTTIARAHDYVTLGEGVANAYVAETASAVLRGLPADPKRPGRALGDETDLKVVYTAMHGVGSEIARRVFRSAALPSVIVVAEQDRPDPKFPSLEFPNPEEPGSLDLAFRIAGDLDADLVVANDPDADRVAIAVKAPARQPARAPRGYRQRPRVASQQFRRLTGNELGLLLGWRAAEREHARAKIAGTEPRGTLASTNVSSPALRAVAEAYNLDYTETLSGFKWVSRVPRLIFGFEEAIGYLTHPGHVRDKDGISAAADAIAMVRELKAEGRTVWDLLDDASELFGHFASSQVTLRLPSMDVATELSARVRTTPPTQFGDTRITRARDLMNPGEATVPANVLRYDLADGSRVMVRPSGTEPKLKVYLDTFAGDGTAAERRGQAEATLAQLEAAVRGYFDGLQLSA